jgi:imidazolonepropionase-like amidohydrolase
LVATIASLGTASAIHASDQVPGRPPTGPVLLRGGDVHTVSGDVLRGGWVLLDQGKIAGVGKKEDAAPALPASGKTIHVAGKRVYPGLIAVGNELGLVEIPSVRASRDAAEVGQLNPNVRAEVGVNPDSELIPVTRANGVLLNLTVPSGGLVAGTGALLQLDGWTWEDMTLKAPVGMYVAWPRMTVSRPARGDDGDDGPRPPRAEEQIKALDRLLDDTRAYVTAKSASAGPAGGGGGDAKAAATRQNFDARLEAMIPVVRGDVPLLVAAEELRQIESAVALAARQKLKLILVGGYDADRCADLLKANKVPVVIQGTQRLPQRRDAAYDEPFTLPDRLRRAGVTYCLSFSGRSGSNIRNLPYHAGMAAAYGLPPDEAVRAITLYPARILGVGDRVGSIEKGKDATLIVTDGDVLETPTQVELAFVQGRPVDLTSRHTRLWKKYQEKYRPR